jgi:hypothetical protein
MPGYGFFSGKCALSMIIIQLFHSLWHPTLRHVSTPFLTRIPQKIPNLQRVCPQE